jgi:glutamyl-tRNA synthetase
MVGKVLVERGLATEAESAFAKKAAAMCANSIELVEDAASEVEAILGYPLAENAEDAKMAKIFEDDFGEIADAVVAGFDSGELRSAIEAGEFKAFVNATGKALERKGKRLFMPFRVALTGRMQGPDVGEVMDLLLAEGVPDKAVKLEERVEELKKMSDKWSK